MLEHFLTYMGEAKMLSTPPPEEQLVNDLIRHFPREIQYMWVLRKGTSIIEAAEFLRRFDTIESQVGGMTSKLTSPMSEGSHKRGLVGGNPSHLIKRSKNRKEVSSISTEPGTAEFEENTVDLN